MQRTLVTADLHLSSNLRDRYRVKILKRMVKAAQRMGVTETFILGDLTEEKDRHNDWLTNTVVDIIRRFSELGPVIIPQGNHDYNSDPDMPFFQFVRHLPRVQWIGKPTPYESTGCGRVLLLPHTRSYKTEWSGLSFKGYAHVFAHGTFEHASLGNGRNATGGIPLSVFPKDCSVISGDVHIPHRTRCVTYVGAPYTVDFGDDYKARCLIIDENGVLSHPIKGPQKRLVEFDGSTNEADEVDHLNEGDILKIRVRVQRKDADRWPEFRDKMRSWAKESGYVVHSIIPDVQEQLGSRVQLTKARVKSDEQIMEEFAADRAMRSGMLKHGMKLL